MDTPDSELMIRVPEYNFRLMSHRFSGERYMEVRDITDWLTKVAEENEGNQARLARMMRDQIESVR